MADKKVKDGTEDIPGGGGFAGDMCFTFQIKGDPANWNPGTVYFYDCWTNRILGVHNTEELTYLKKTYSETHAGRQLKHYTWDTKAPVWIRFFGVVQPTDEKGGQSPQIRDLLKKAQKYRLIYGSPKHFKASMRLLIREKPDKVSEILGYSNVGDTFDLKDTITACDYHWGKIDYKGQEAWIPLGDILGDLYGEWS